MIRKTFITIAALNAGYCAFSQNETDAIRYAQPTFFGDARFMGMGGAFGSLGANISCMNFNPAGIALYRKGEFVFTPGLNFQNSNATHYGTSTQDSKAGLTVANLGFVAAWDQQVNTPPPANNNGGYYNPNGNNPSQPSAPKPQRNAIGVSFTRLADFNYHVTLDGNATNSSIMNSFRDAANGTDTAHLNQYYEGAAYQAYLINPYVDNNNHATSQYYGYPDFVSGDYRLRQTKTIRSSGRMNEFSIAFAHSFNDQFYLGGSIGIPTIKYNYQADYQELNSYHDLPYFKSLSYQENLITTGTGINLKLGGIYRTKAGIRLGVYGQTPTYFKLTDSYQNSAIGNFDTTGSNGYLPTQANFTSDPGSFIYKLRTPAKLGGSVSYVFKKILAFSVDAEYVNYSMSKFSGSANDPDISSTNSYFNDVNRSLSNDLKGTANLRAGLELNIKPMLVRVGFNSQGSPYGDVLNGYFVKNSFCAGIGFRGNSNVYFDLGAVYTRWKENYYVIDPAYVDASTIQQSTLYIMATLGIKFK